MVYFLCLKIFVTETLFLVVFGNTVSLTILSFISPNPSDLPEYMYSWSASLFWTVRWVSYYKVCLGLFKIVLFMLSFLWLFMLKFFPFPSIRSILNEWFKEFLELGEITFFKGGSILDFLSYEITWSRALLMEFDWLMFLNSPEISVLDLSYLLRVGYLNFYFISTRAFLAVEPALSLFSVIRIFWLFNLLRSDLPSCRIA